MLIILTGITRASIGLNDTILPHTQALCATSSYARSASLAPVPRWDPATLYDGDLLVEERSRGPLWLTVRLVSALLPVEDSVDWKGVKAAEEATEGRHGVGVSTAAGDKVSRRILSDGSRIVWHITKSSKPAYCKCSQHPLPYELTITVSVARVRRPCGRSDRLRPKAGIARGSRCRCYE